jgi:hypothetical protein
MNEGIKEYVTEMIGEGKDFFEILEGLKARIPLGESSDDYYDEVLEMCDRANIKSVGSTTEELRNIIRCGTNFPYGSRVCETNLYLKNSLNNA